MPQFDPASFASQIFWLVVTFAALYWVVAKIAIPRIGEVLDQRARVIQDDLDRAEQLKAETDAAIESYEEAMNAAREQAHDHIRGVQAEMKAVSDKRTAEVSAKVGARIKDAEARIAKAKQEAMDGLAAVAAETAGEVVAKLAAISPDSSVVDAAVSKALKGSR